MSNGVNIYQAADLITDDEAERAKFLSDELGHMAYAEMLGEPVDTKLQAAYDAELKAWDAEVILRINAAGGIKLGF